MKINHRIGIAVAALIAIMLPTAAMASTSHGATSKPLPRNSFYTTLCVHAASDIVCQLTPLRHTGLTFSKAVFDGHSVSILPNKDWKLASAKNVYGQKEFSSRAGLFYDDGSYYAAFTGIKSFPKKYTLSFYNTRTEGSKKKPKYVTAELLNYTLTSYASHLGCCNPLP